LTRWFPLYDDRHDDLRTRSPPQPAGPETMTTLSRLGELLVRRGQLEAAHLERAMTEQRTHGGVMSHLVKLGHQRGNRSFRI
jgi:hypothetical protein